MPEIYKTNTDNTARFILGKYNKRPLVVFGINPSTATKEKNDTTISIVEQIVVMTSEKLRCDGYIMLNIYPLRATKIDKSFDQNCNYTLSEENLQCISNSIPENGEIIAAWGTNITSRGFFIDLLSQINNIVKAKNGKWITLSLTKGGHPHHPTRLAYDKMTFEPFDIDSYIASLKRTKR